MSSWALEAERETWDAIAASELPSTVRAGYRQMFARYRGACDACGEHVSRGDVIHYSRRHELRLICQGCADRANAGAVLEAAR